MNSANTVGISKLSQIYTAEFPNGYFEQDFSEKLESPDNEKETIHFGKCPICKKNQSDEMFADVNSPCDKCDRKIHNLK